MPQFQTPPVKYISRHEFARVMKPSPAIAEDELLIGDVTEKELKFYFYMIGTNGHICGGSGVATAREGAYYFEKEFNVERIRFENEKLISWKEPAVCRLRIEFNAKQAALHDEGGLCQQTLCGSRASISATTFLREAPRPQAGFDCGKAVTNVEKLICGDEHLSRLDRDLSQQYAELVTVSDHPALVRDSQREWLRSRRNSCLDVACLRKVYEQRINELAEMRRQH